MSKIRFLKGFFIVIFAICLSFFTFLGYLHFSPGLKIEVGKFTKESLSITFYDSCDNEIGRANSEKRRIDIKELPPHITQAFIAVEDKRFFKHNGVDLYGIARAIKNNLLSKGVKEGGSTITQQLIKNTHLSSEKTISRKIKEIKLALKLERLYSKDEILEFYLNSIYFGEGAYGIESASLNYFGKSATQLSIIEAAALASTIKAPSIYNPRKAECAKRSKIVLSAMKDQNYITSEEYETNLSKEISTVKREKNEYLDFCEEECFALLEKYKISPYHDGEFKVYTYMEKSRQNALCESLTENYQGGIITSCNGKIKGYKLPQGDFSRPTASLIKPVFVYAPAIEEGVIHLDSKVLDEKTNFGNYSPSNYNEKYYGWVSAKEAIYRSLNIPAIKVLDSVGIEKARLYARKLGIQINKNELSSALGAYENGSTLKEITASYTPFTNQGLYTPLTAIRRIEKNGVCIYKDQTESIQVFSAGTCEIINDALQECANIGTAKAIGKREYSICAKTGTAGNDKGNTDAYIIAYTSEDIISLRFCNADNSLMPNTVTGGFVAKYASNILNSLYKNKMPKDFAKSNEVTYAKACLLSYQKGILALADERLPNRYTFYTPILTKYIKSVPISSLTPLLEDCLITVKNNELTIKFDKDREIFCKIEIKLGDKFEEIATTNEEIFTIRNLTNGVYTLKITPILTLGGCEKIEGTPKEYTVKINENSQIINSPWWEE